MVQTVVGNDGVVEAWYDATHGSTDDGDVMVYDTDMVVCEVELEVVNTMDSNGPFEVIPHTESNMYDKVEPQNMVGVETLVEAEY